MSKVINLSGLKTLLEPLVHLINKKAERPDWNENDPSSPNHIENRTHWETAEESQLLQATINDSIVEGLPFTSFLEEDHTYTVIWDGVEYQCLSYDDGYGEICIGNRSIAIVNGWEFPETIQSDEPFFICTYAPDDWNVVVCEGGTHTVEIHGMVTTVHKIDEKYLPEMVGRHGMGNGSAVFNGAKPINATGYNSHAEGTQDARWVNDTIQVAQSGAHGDHSHAEGDSVYVSGYAAHAEGQLTNALGRSSHAEGQSTEANGDYSHSEGYLTQANGYASHAEGYHTIANGEKQHVQGSLNIADDTSLHIVGNGTQSGFESNAHTLAWDGTAWYAGDVYVGSTSGTNKDEGSEKLATESYVETKVVELVNSAPETLNTLNELATALGNDPNFATTISNQIGTKASSSDLTSHTGNKSNPHDVTAAQISAVPTSRTVNGKALTADITLSASDVNAAESSHNQAADTITAGTFAGAVVAQASSQTPATSLLRNSKLVPEETDPVNNGEICWIYE